MTSPLRNAAAFSLVAALAFLAGQRSARADAQPRVFELRTYTTLDGRLPDLLTRFREHTMTIFERHGMSNIVYLQPTGGLQAKNTLVYLLAHPSRAAADKAWQEFQADPEWQKVRTESEKNGKIVEKVDRLYLTPTDFSPMR